MNDPRIETNDENLDRPWAWLARVPCVACGPDGEPYAGAAELRVLLANHDRAACPDAFQHAPPIHLHGLYPFGPLRDSMDAIGVGMFVLTHEEARALGAALMRAAEIERATHRPDGPESENP